MKAHAILPMLVVLAAAEIVTEDRFQRRRSTRLTVLRTLTARSRRSKAMDLSTRGKADTEKICRSQSTNQEGIRSAQRTDLCFAICRFSTVRFITPSHLTHNLFKFLFPIVFGIMPILLPATFAIRFLTARGSLEAGCLLPATLLVLDPLSPLHDLYNAVN